MQRINTMSKIKNQLRSKGEICNECGKNVGFNSGLFINRVIDLDNYKTRKERNKLFPQGDYICRECEEKLLNMTNKKYGISKSRKFQR